jgi:hypothetical protein
MILAITVLVALFIADTAMTLWAMNHGYKELNKLMKWVVAHPAVAVLVTAVKAAIACCVILYLFENGAVVGAWIGVVVFTAIATYPIVHNIMALRRRKK